MKKKIQQETEEEQRAREMVEEIAQNIVSLSNSVKILLGGKVKKSAIIILLAHSTKMFQHQVETVLDAIASMDETFLK
jgi:putative AlgH/UPF0301 family transcriptional regulator